jgi:hypothetical protein
MSHMRRNKFMSRMSDFIMKRLLKLMMLESHSGEIFFYRNHCKKDANSNGERQSIKMKEIFTDAFYVIIYVKLIICEVLMNMMHSSCKILLKRTKKMCFSFLTLHIQRLLHFKMWMPSKKSFSLLSFVRFVVTYKNVHICRRDVN